VITIQLKKQKTKQPDAKQVRVAENCATNPQVDKTYINEWQLQILKNKLPCERVFRHNILTSLDIAFEFNRSALARYLAKQGLTGYSRQHLYKLLGNPIVCSKEYVIMKRVFSRIGEPSLLPLMIQKKGYKKINYSALGGSPVTVPTIQ
jgi:hypothetical protein